MADSSFKTACLIGLGSNLGAREQALEQAAALFQRIPDIEWIGQSAWYVSKAVGGPPEQDDFLNGAVLVRAERDPQSMLDLLQTIESQVGRERSVRWAPRRLDLDLLLFGDQVATTGELTLPHPWMAIRPFVLRPALEVAAEMQHPQLRMTIAELWQLMVRPTKVISVMPAHLSTDETSSLRSLVARIALRAEADFFDLPSASRALSTRLSESRPANRCVVTWGWLDDSALSTDQIRRPNVTAVLAAASASTSNDPELQRCLDDLCQRPPEMIAPHLVVPAAAERVTHDLTAILDGFSNTDLQPVN